MVFPFQNDYVINITIEEVIMADEVLEEEADILARSSITCLAMRRAARNGPSPPQPRQTAGLAKPARNRSAKYYPSLPKDQVFA